MARDGRSGRISRRQLVHGGLALGALALAGRRGVVMAAPGRVAQEAPSGSARFPIWTGQADIEAWNQVIDLFQQAVPDVEIAFEPVQWEQFWQKLNTQLAAGDAPASCGMHVGLVYSYAEKKQLVDLNPLIQRDGYALDQLFPNLVEEGRWPKTGDNAGLYMLPWRFVGSAFYVNKTLLDQRGIPMPTEGWTWDDWVEIATKVADKDAGVYGSSLPFPLQIHQPYFMQAGASGPLSDDLTKSNWLDPGIQETVQFFADLALTHEVAPRPEDVPLATGGAAQDLFLAGRVALHPSATWNIPAYRDVEFEWDVVPQPQHKAKGAYAGPDAIAIPTDGDNPEAAWAFIKFATLDTEAQTILGATGIPVTRELALSDAYINAEAEKRPASYRVLVNELTTLGKGFSFNKSWFEWHRDVTQIMPQIYNGKLGVDEGLQQINDKVNEILQRPA